MDLKTTDCGLNLQEYKDFFKIITGFYPYKFQISIAEKLLNNKNVIMQAPTGSGKTWASIMPYLYSCYKGINFPRKLIYSLPLRVLANSLYSEVNEKINRIDSIFKRKPKVTIQTGENNQDPYLLEGDIIFTTIDQSLSSLLSIPLSLSINQGNINPGVIFTSYLVFDEFHLLEVGRALSTLYNILNKISDITPFCLMTATLSDELLDNYSKKLNAEKIFISPEEITNIGSQVNKIRNVIVKKEAINIENIVKEHKKKSIIICNTVDSCKEVYLNLKKEKEKNQLLKNTQLTCIHSQFFSQDRREKEELIKKYFSKNSNENAILVATQVIEVGIDISCEVMHTEISPINSFLQRIGRCVRYGGENGVIEKGLIFVYDVKNIKNNGEEKNNSYLPYDFELCMDTYNNLMRLGERQNLDYFKSQELINDILMKKELKEFNSINENQINRFEEIISCWLKPERSYASRLIRQIDSVNVLISSNTNEISDPYIYEMISINRYSLLSKLKDIEKEYDDDWIIKVIVESNFDDDFWGKYSYISVGVNDIRLKNENILILNSKYVFYDEEIGLNFQGIGEKQSYKLVKNDNKKNFIITKDTYIEHIELMIKVYEEYFKDEISYISKKIEQKYKVDFNIDEIIKFIIIIHDYGKLNEKWQAAVRSYQSKNNKYNTGEILAHTDFNPEYDKKIQLPNHAGIGAIVGFALVEQIFEEGEEIGKVILNTIVKHHSIYNFSSEKYKIIKDGRELIEKLLKKYCPSIVKKIDFSDEILFSFDKCEFRNEDVISFSKIKSNFEALLYFISSRILRICDQKSFDFKER
ncbi:hypothetical protein Q428_02910 [Fervidicella metallireducens AeB]|uniref:CRISPR-associated protein Cas3 n=1 Tax=Fervidicella metallireducens AeB TaxID=1403537 RepID=A0A017RXV3_9CLOT|nr:CRISPR-associated helicase/endonuclease Cas3 [Fervidicella metallireducens]EYE89416.1 hypothetical protein Q428_02910 [Fervidicella metallireducens AeB]